MSYSGHLFNGGVISSDPLFCLRKFYGDIQFFYTRIFNCSSLLKPLADLCSRDKEKNTSYTCGCEPVSKFISLSTLIKFQTLSSSFPQGGGACESALNLNRVLSVQRHDLNSYSASGQNFRSEVKAFFHRKKIVHGRSEWNF